MDPPTQSVMSQNRIPSCTNCQQYLSVAPIYINEKGYWCGRCESTLMSKLDSFGQTFHLTAYEAIAQSVQFLCQYDVFGCRKKLDFKDVEIHERFCQFRPGKCPIHDCQLRIPVDQLLAHYQDYHKELIVDSREFSIVVKENLSQNYVTVLSSKAYILSITTFTKKKTIHLGLYDFNCGDNVKRGNYLLEVKNKATNSLIVSEEPIQKYIPNSNLTNARVLRCKDLQRALKGDNLFFSIRLPGVERSPRSEMLEELDCILCQEQMKAPIYICTTGHSICFKCKNRVARCPFCKAVFGGARNFALEKLSETLAKKEELSKTAELIVKCPLEIPQQCEWIGLAGRICDHSRANHPNHTFCGTTTVTKDMKAPTVAENFVVFFDSTTFKVFVKHNQEGPLLCTVLHNDLAAFEEPQYRFIVNFSDSNGQRKMTVSHLCYSTHDHAQSEADTISFIAIELPHNCLKPYINEKELLTFSIEIKLIETG